MDNTQAVFYISILIFSVCAVFLLIILFMGHRFLRLKEKELEYKLLQRVPTLDPADLTKPTLKKLSLSMGPLENSSQCPLHPDVFASRTCALSGELFCPECVVKQLDVWVAKKYLSYFNQDNWTQFAMVEDKKENQDKIDRIKKIKRDLWMKENIPLIIQSNHKINIEDDKIETFTLLLGRENDRLMIEPLFQFLT